MNYRLAVSMTAIVGVLSFTEGSPAAQVPELDRLDCRPPPAAATPPSSSSDYDGVPNSKLEYEVKWNSHDTPEVRVAARVLGERKERNKDSADDLNRAVELFRLAAFVAPPEFRPLPNSRGGLVNRAMPRSNGGPGLMNYVDQGPTPPYTPGDTIAMHRLAEMYRDGVGLPQDAQRAQILMDCLVKYGAVKP
jgi:hypothetical protein